MGQVATIQDVIARRLPTSADFLAVGATFEATAEQLVSSGSLVSAVRFGSCIPGGAPSLRSDFDYLAVHDGSDEGFEAAALLASKAFHAGLGRVPIGDIPYSQQALESGRHELDRFFGQHLTGSDRYVIGVDPAAFIRFGDEPALDILNGYIRTKKRKLSIGRTTLLAGERHKSMQRMLELPLAVGRKTLRVIDELTGSDLSPKNSADKTEVARRSVALYAQLGAAKTAQDVLELDAEYTAVLTSTLNGTSSLRDYNQMVARLHQTMPTAIRWLDELDESLNHEFS